MWTSIWGLPRVATFSSAESGSGQPPDRAQICPMMMMMPFNTFFSEPVSEPPKWTCSRRNTKKNVRKSDIAANMSIELHQTGPGSNYSLVETVFRKRVVVVAGIGK